MIEREKINKEIENLIEKNRLEKCFLPIIEEFFFRVADQCNWDEYDFKVAINKFEKVRNIGFTNFWETTLLILKQKECAAATQYCSSNNSISIFFDIDQLKGILKFDKSQIENFINDAMHELGHALQPKRKDHYLSKNINDLLYFGFKIYEINPENQIYIDDRSTILNEFAEVINADRLQNGYISENKKRGYPDIQNAGQIVLSSLGITALEFANLQFKGREDYEKFVANRLRLPSYKTYIDGFEEILDAIDTFSNSKNQRNNFISQIDSLQTLSKKIFEERFNNIIENSNDILGDLAKLIIDKEDKNNALRMVFDEFKIKQSELHMDKRKRDS